MCKLKKFIFVLLGLLIFIAVSGCGSKSPEATGVNSDKTAKMKVVASIYPVYDFAKQVGGDKVDLVQLVPPGVEPHEWEPTAKDLIQVKAAKVFLYQGNGFEGWINKVLDQGKTPGQIVAQVGQNLADLAPVKDEAEAKNHEEQSHHGSEFTHDPHVWLDPVKAQEEVRNIAKVFSEADPTNAAYYQSNADQVAAQLDGLHQEYNQALSKTKQRDLVTTHAAFGYLAQRYNLHQVPVMGLSPDAEPTPDKLAQVVEFVKTNHVKVIFFETLVSPKLAETISRETGARTLVLNPLEGLTDAELQAGRNYFTVMRENLKHLQEALN